MARVVYDGDLEEVKVNLEGGIVFKKDEVTEVDPDTAEKLIPRSDFRWYRKDADGPLPDEDEEEEKEEKEKKSDSKKKKKKDKKDKEND